MTEPTIRPSRPEDVAAAVPLIFSAGPDAYNFVFGHKTPVDAQGFLTHAFVCTGGEFSWPVHWVMELDGEVVGTAAGYTGKTARHFMWPAIAQILRCNGIIAGAGVIRRGLQIERIVVPPRRADLFYIANVGIAPHHRGKGLGWTLLKHMHEEGRRQGATVAALDVSMENPRAEALYRRIGYRIVRETPSTLRNAAGHVPGHRRMEFALPDAPLEVE